MPHSDHVSHGTGPGQSQFRSQLPSVGSLALLTTAALVTSDRRRPGAAVLLPEALADGDTALAETQATLLEPATTENGLNPGPVSGR